MEVSYWQEEQRVNLPILIRDKTPKHNATQRSRGVYIVIKPLLWSHVRHRRDGYCKAIYGELMETTASPRICAKVKSLV